eukprot:TRINITY_DN23029_c0_g1_i1.p1 TRINITY_DN23029_c0_g1~~TRINITY_DN23029_c0_g1_i1.p1  ORF type:complete len:379 (-),score=121.63 TRINITY_DN23029_c0_g1_i1:2-1138(-)
MLRYGAEEILRSTTPANTSALQTQELMKDDEFEQVLRKSEERTREMQSKFKEVASNAEQFSMDDGDVAPNYQQWEGVDWSEKRKSKQGSNVSLLLDALSLPKRERHVNYSERSVALVPRKPGQKNPKQPTIHDFQFFPERLHELLEKEKLAFYKRFGNQDGQDQDSAMPASASSSDLIEDLTEAEIEEKEKLLTQGFADWKRRDFQAFVRACERYGRKSYSDIAAEVAKTKEEVKKYSQVFWANVDSLTDGPRIVKNIEKGEQRLQRFDQMTKVLEKKMKGFDDPLRQCSITYPPGNSQKTYTEEEDVFLLASLYDVGYGNWDALKRRVLGAWQFKFDFFLRTRSPLELSRRADSLLRFVLKEQEKSKDEQPSKRSRK